MPIVRDVWYESAEMEMQKSLKDWIGEIKGEPRNFKVPCSQP